MFSAPLTEGQQLTEESDELEWPCLLWLDDAWSVPTLCSSQLLVGVFPWQQLRLLTRTLVSV